MSHPYKNSNQNSHETRITILEHDIDKLDNLRQDIKDFRNEINGRFTEINGRFDYIDKKINNLENRLWQVSIIIITPIFTLIIAKLFHLI